MTYKQALNKLLDAQAALGAVRKDGPIVLGLKARRELNSFQYIISDLLMRCK